LPGDGDGDQCSACRLARVRQREPETVSAIKTQATRGVIGEVRWTPRSRRCASNTTSGTPATRYSLSHSEYPARASNRSASVTCTVVATRGKGVPGVSMRRTSRSGARLIGDRARIDASRHSSQRSRGVETRPPMAPTVTDRVRPGALDRPALHGRRPGDGEAVRAPSP